MDATDTRQLQLTLKFNAQADLFGKNQKYQFSIDKLKIYNRKLQAGEKVEDTESSVTMMRQDGVRFTFVADEAQPAALLTLNIEPMSIYFSFKVCGGNVSGVCE